ncbi:hypothetical protein EMIT0P265_80054 [Pseudomonas zeae]
MRRCMRPSDRARTASFLPDPYLSYTEIHCRSEPARDSGVSNEPLVSDTPLSRAGSLLQGFA